MKRLKFIKYKDFRNHVKETLDVYFDSLEAYDLATFNSNVIDPIKLLFDKNVLHENFDDVIRDEIRRQRDKTDNNAIGYFHQNIFKYIKRCEVPKEYWDVIFHGETDYFVEMKNKHNTMNSSSAQKTYIKLQNQIAKNPNSFACLVEVIAKKSQNIPWECSVDGNKMRHEHIRRISIDQFYKIVTGIDDAFVQICTLLPSTIEELLKGNTFISGNDTVIDELKAKNPDLLKALYGLAFSTYEGFDKLIDN